MHERAPELAEDLPTDAGQTARVLEEVSESFLKFLGGGPARGRAAAELATSPEVLATVPFFDATFTTWAGSSGSRQDLA